MKPYLISDYTLNLQEFGSQGNKYIFLIFKCFSVKKS